MDKSKNFPKFMFFIILLVISIYWPLYAENTTRKKALILNSYHRGFEWSDSIIEGIESVFFEKAQDVQLYFEYMDTKHIYNTEYLDQLHVLYSNKYRNIVFDVIITSDNNAFDFISKYHDTIFPESPVIFCGVNDFKESSLENKNCIENSIYLEGKGIYNYLDQLKEQLGLNFKFNIEQARCSNCNSILKKVKDKKDIEQLIIKETYNYYHEFFQCKNLKCKKIYWKGSHIEDIEKRLEKNNNLK